MMAMVALAAVAPDVERALEEWDVPAAEQGMAELGAANDPETAYLRGRLRFQQGRYAEAVEQLGRATQARDEANWKATLALAQSVFETTRDFARRESAQGHFVIFFKPGKDELLIEPLGEALEAQRRALLDDFGFSPPEPVRVEVFPEVSDLARVSMLTASEIETSGVIALCKWNRLMLTSPRALLRGYPWLDAAAHEYVHYVVSRLTHDRVPVWLHEGIAKRKEQRWRLPDDGRAALAPAVEDLLARAVEKNALIPLAKLHPSIAKLPSQKDATLAFAQVATLVETMENRAGTAGLTRLLERLRDGMELQRALEKVVGGSLVELERDWKVALRARGLKKRPNVLQLGLEFRGTDSGDDADDQVLRGPNPARLADAKAQRFARLGALLEEQSRERAAVVEYEKALVAARSSAPLVSARLATLYLHGGQAEAALRAARDTLAVYPDFAGAHVSAGQALVRLGRMQEAADAFFAALRVNPFDPRVHCGLAEAWRGAGDTRANRAQTTCSQLQPAGRFGLAP